MDIDLNSVAAWATILTAVIVAGAWAARKTWPSLKDGVRRLRRRRGRWIAHQQLKRQTRVAQHELGGVLMSGALHVAWPDTHEAWNRALRRRLICPARVASTPHGQLGVLKRVLTSATPPLMVEVVLADGSVAEWNASLVVSVDEVSVNAEILEAYRQWSNNLQSALERR